MPVHQRIGRGAPGRRYRVVVQYREPTYARQRGLPDRVHRASLEVVAIDPDHAQEKARNEILRRRAEGTISWMIEFDRLLVFEV